MKQHISNILSGETLTDEQIIELHSYHCDPSKEEKYQKIKSACVELMKVVRDNAPPCSDRTRAFQAIREVRMLANSSVALDSL
jgi:hypothetical protein